MTMIECSGCKAAIHIKAKACPQCGAPNKPRKKTSPVTLALAIAMAIGTGVAIKMQADQPPPPPLTPQEQARKTLEAQQDTLAIAGAQTLKAAMHSPDSFALKELLVTHSGAACYTYTAKNAFNATLQSSAVLPPGGARLLGETTDGNAFARAWNTHCAHQAARDLTQFASRRLD